MVGTSYQQGGQIQQPQQPQPKGQGGPGMMQQLTPEQMENQKVDMKAAELQNKANLQQDPSQQSPLERLRAALLPPRPKLRPQPTMKVFSNNGEILGRGKED